MVVSSAELRETVRVRYGGRAEAVLTEGSAACCGAAVTCCGAGPGVNAFSEGLYAVSELEGVPLSAALATLGCGNPIALAGLRPGEVVLDLGCGAGLDVMLAAKLIGPTGHAFGIDITGQMLALAWRNALAAGVSNVTFLRGDMGDLPVPDSTVDIVISNCVINLAIDKGRVIAEMFRAIRPGGRIAVADVVILGGLPDDISISDDLRRDAVAWGSCLAGALSDDEYQNLLLGAGFVDVELEVVRHHTASELFVGDLPEWAARADPATLEHVLSRFASAFVRASRP